MTEKDRTDRIVALTAILNCANADSFLKSAANLQLWNAVVLLNPNIHEIYEEIKPFKKQKASSKK